MTWQTTQLLFVALAGVGAGALNAALGGGMLIMYPVMLTVGLSPVPANAASSISLVPASSGGAWQYRRELAGRQRGSVLGWMAATGAGALVGAVLVVALPSTVFNSVIPWLIILACAIFAVQPLLGKLAARWRQSAMLPPVLGAIGVYGGYFGGAQGMLYLAALTYLDGPDVQRANAVKNLLVASANGAAGAVFVLAGQVFWVPALIGAAGAVVGGLAGGAVARTLPSWLLRALVVAVGLYGAGLALTRA